MCLTAYARAKEDEFGIEENGVRHKPTGLPLHLLSRRPHDDEPAQEDVVRAHRLGIEDEYVCLNQIRTIDYRRSSSKVGRVDTDDFDRVREAFGRRRRFGASRILEG